MRIIEDSAAEYDVVSTGTRHSTPIFDIVEDTFAFGSGDDAEHLTRAYMKHTCAVAVLALDTEDRVLLVNQYRHPPRMKLWEIPAGLLDLEAEPMLDAAERELAEEADLRADTWHTLTDFYTSPGCSNEALRVYLAEDLTEIPEAEQHTREAEEAGIEKAWVPLAEAVQAVLSGRIHNPTAVTGILSLHAVRSGGGELRGPRAPWGNHPRRAAP